MTETVSNTGKTSKTEAIKNTRDGFITIAGVTAGAVTAGLTTYLGISNDTALILSPVFIGIYNILITYLSRKYNWLRVDSDGTLIVGSTTEKFN